MAKKRGLGSNNLSKLLSNSPATSAALKADSPAAEPAPKPAASEGPLRDVPVEWLQRGKYQPRRDMRQDALEELAASIKSQGVMQPIVVRAVSKDRFEIVAGERRWRAAQLAGLSEVPVLVRDIADETAMAMALIENIQREDLNPMEEALALLRLQKEFELTHQEIGELVGKSRSAVSNLLRLTSLREEVQRMLENGDIEMGHARALLALPADQQSQAAATIVSKGLSVRQTESLVRRLLQEAENPSSKASTAIDPDIRKLQDDLSERLGAAVALQHGAKGKGKLVIKYNSLDELDGILNHIK